MQLITWGGPGMGGGGRAGGAVRAPGEALRPALLTASSLCPPHSLPAPGQAHAGRLRSSHSSQYEVMRRRCFGVVWAARGAGLSSSGVCVCVCVQLCTCVCVCVRAQGRCAQRGCLQMGCVHGRGTFVRAATAGGTVPHCGSPRWGGAPLQHPGVQPMAAERSKPHTGPQPPARGKYLPSVLPCSTG